MEDSDRKRIHSNITELCSIIKMDTIIPFLMHKKIFTSQMIDDILLLSNENERKMRLLIDLCRRGPDAYDKFVDVLIETGHNDAAKILCPKRKLVRMGSMPLSNMNITLRKSPNITPNSPINEPISEMPSSEAYNDVIINQSMKVSPALTWAEFEDTYKMESNPRGYCLLFNNVDFDNNAFETRHGSDTDAKQLDEVFQELGFIVVLKRNVSAKDMKKFASHLSKKTELKIMNAFVMIVLSHGHKNLVYGTDNVAVNIFEDLVSPFNNKNCPNLIGKPKMFFIQACRGSEIDFGVKIPQEVPRTIPGIPQIKYLSEASGDSIQQLHEIKYDLKHHPNYQNISKLMIKLPHGRKSFTDPGNYNAELRSRDRELVSNHPLHDLVMNPRIDNISVPDANKFTNPCDNEYPTLEDDDIQRISTWSDIIISYPTVFGYVAMRNPELGSWYGSSLVSALTEHSCDYRLIDILSLVNRRVQNMQSHTGDKQSTAVKLIGWNKKLYFNPGLYK